MTQSTEKKTDLDQSELDGIAGGYSIMEESIADMKEQARRDNAWVEAARAAEAAAEAAANATPAPPKRDYGRYSGGRLS